MNIDINTANATDITTIATPTINDTTKIICLRVETDISTVKKVKKVKEVKEVNEVNDTHLTSPIKTIKTTKLKAAPKHTNNTNIDNQSDKSDDECVLDDLSSKYKKKNTTRTY